MKAIADENELVRELFTVGAHYGYSKTRRHPSVSPFIFGTKNHVELFDLEKTSSLLSTALDFSQKLGSEGKMILFVGGKKEAAGLVQKAAERLSMPYVAGRWLGGTLTNFQEIRKRVNRLEELTEKRESGEFQTKYTKLERLMLDREIEELEQKFKGLIPMKEKPAALFVVDTSREKTAVREAKELDIPVIGLQSSDCNVEDSTYPIVGNDTSRASIMYFIDKLVGAYEDGLKRREVPSEAKS